MHPYIENNKQPIYLSYHRKSYDFPTHFHQNIELAYCFSGAQTIVVGEEIFSLKSGGRLSYFSKYHSRIPNLSRKSRSRKPFCYVQRLSFDHSFSGFAVQTTSDSLSFGKRTATGYGFAVSSTFDRRKSYGAFGLYLPDFISDIQENRADFLPIRSGTSGKNYHLY